MAAAAIHERTISSETSVPLNGDLRPRLPLTGWAARVRRIQTVIRRAFRKGPAAGPRTHRRTRSDAA